MKKIAYLFLLIVLATSCKRNHESPGVNVSITNASNENFKTLQVTIDGKEFKFNNLAPAQSETIKVKQTYRYFYVKAVTETDELVIQPIDFVGEKLINSGTLNFKLQIDHANNRRTLQLDSKELPSK